MSNHRLSWLDWRGQIDVAGWWTTGGVVLAGALAAIPDATIETLLPLLALVVVADPLLGGLWSGLHSVTDEPTSEPATGIRRRIRLAFERRPLLSTPLRLIWAPVLAVALAYLVRPAAAFVAGGMVLLTVLAAITSLARLATPRAIMAVGLPWLLAYVAFDGDLRLWPIWGVLLLGVVGARSLFVPKRILGAAALPLLSILLLFAHAPVGATIVWILWTIVLLFHVQSTVRDGSWYLRHAQVWFVLAIVTASWAVRV